VLIEQELVSSGVTKAMIGDNSELKYPEIIVTCSRICLVTEKRLQFVRDFIANSKLMQYREQDYRFSLSELNNKRPRTDPVFSCEIAHLGSDTFSTLLELRDNYEQL